MQDANFNVLGLVNASGALVERYEYTPYGQRKVLFAAGNTWAGNTSTNDPGCYAIAYASLRYTSNAPYFGLCDIGHQGLMHEEESDLLHDRFRFVATVLGMFLSRDRVHSCNLFQRVNSNPGRFVDPAGLEPAGVDAFGAPTSRPTTQPSTMPSAPPVSAGITYIKSKIDEYDALLKDCWLYKAAGLDQLFIKIRAAAGKAGVTFKSSNTTQGKFDSGNYELPPNGYAIDTAVHESVHAYNYFSGFHQAYGTRAKLDDEGMAWTVQYELDSAQWLCQKFRCADCDKAQATWNTVWKFMDQIVGSQAGTTSDPANVTRTNVWDVNGKLKVLFSESQLRPLFQQALRSRGFDCSIKPAPGITGGSDADGQLDPFK